MPTNMQPNKSSPDNLPAYLCNRHLEHAKQNPAAACRTWANLIKTGNHAYEQNDLNLADLSYGAASEIARSLICCGLNYSGQLYAAERFLIATHNLSVTLAAQNKHPLAGELLVRIHKELLAICNDVSLHQDTRATAYSCLEPSLERIQPFLDRAEDKKTAQELKQLTTNIHHEAKNKFCH